MLQTHEMSRSGGVQQSSVKCKQEWKIVKVVKEWFSSISHLHLQNLDTSSSNRGTGGAGAL